MNTANQKTITSEELATLVAVAKTSANAALAPYGFEIGKGTFDLSPIKTELPKNEDGITPKGSACICINGICGCVIY